MGARRWRERSCVWRLGVEGERARKESKREGTLGEGREGLEDVVEGRERGVVEETDEVRGGEERDMRAERGRQRGAHLILRRRRHPDFDLFPLLSHGTQ